MTSVFCEMQWMELMVVNRRRSTNEVRGLVSHVGFGLDIGRTQQRKSGVLFEGPHTRPAHQATSR